MKINTLLAAATGATLLLGACNNETTTTETTETVTETKTEAPAAAVALADVSPSPEFPGATLTVTSAKAEQAGNDSTKVSFAFAVKNYELKMQTGDNESKLCNNSGQGQHIHFILDNQPYKALYEPKNEVTLANGSEHYLLAFLSRSYHESIKEKGAAILYHFKIDEKGNLKKLEEPKETMLFYSRPKGDYFGKDTTNLLLDYYVWDGQLTADGFKVKAEINNVDRPAQQLTATLDKWQPRFIQNLGTGKSKITLTLMDKDGKVAQGPQSVVSREFTMMAQEPSKQ